MPDKQTTLLPCPFCGGKAGFGGGAEGAFVNCIECLASTNVLSPWKQTQEDAAEAWNKRVVNHG